MNASLTLGVIAILVSIIMGIPDWLPVFGVTPEWFGGEIARISSSAAPALFAIGFVGISAGLVGKVVIASKQRNADRKAMTSDVEADSEDARRLLMMVPVWGKAFLKTAVDKGAVYCRNDSRARNFVAGLSSTSNMLVPCTLERERIRFTPTEQFRKLRADNPNLFEEISDETIAKYALYDPDKLKTPSWHRSNELDWWWYSDDPEVDYEKVIDREIAEVERRHKNRNSNQRSFNVFEDSL